VVNIIRVREGPELQVRLKRIDQTDKCWLFTFWDWQNRFEQKMMVPKTYDGEAMEAIWDDLHQRWREKAFEKEWLRN
jgi:hypothetical protein